MKNTIKMIGITTLVVLIGFTMVACGNDPGDTTLTYKGTNWANNATNEWVLKITGGTYELTKEAGVGWKDTSTGTVDEKQGTTYYLKPSVTATRFTATVTSAGLVELLGTIVWYAGGTPEALPGQLTPSGGTGGAGNNNAGNDSPKQPVVPGENPDSGDDGNSEW